MSYQPRGILTPGASVSRKRKEKEALYSTMSSQTAVNHAVSGANPSASRASISGAEQQPPPSNRLLAGYMAYEFLEKGTVFGHMFEPARAEAAADLKRSRKSQSVSQPSKEAEPSYFEVANLVKSEGVHVAGVVNPTQLARWIQS